MIENAIAILAPGGKHAGAVGLVPEEHALAAGVEPLDHLGAEVLGDVLLWGALGARGTRARTVTTVTTRTQFFMGSPPCLTEAV